MRTGATLNGRALAQTAVTLDASTVTQPGATTAIEENFAPREFLLSQNYPNPFNPKTNIVYQLPMSSKVKIAVFDMTGKEVSILVNEMQSPGDYEIEWDARDYSSGVYICRLEAGPFVSTKKLILLK